MIFYTLLKKHSQNNCLFSNQNWTIRPCQANFLHENMDFCIGKPSNGFKWSWSSSDILTRNFLSKLGSVFSSQKRVFIPKRRLLLQTSNNGQQYSLSKQIKRQNQTISWQVLKKQVTEMPQTFSLLFIYFNHSSATRENSGKFKPQNPGRKLKKIGNPKTRPFIDKSIRVQKKKHSCHHFHFFSLETEKTQENSILKKPNHFLTCPNKRKFKKNKNKKTKKKTSSYVNPFAPSFSFLLCPSKQHAPWHPKPNQHPFGCWEKPEKCILKKGGRREWPYRRAEP